MINPYLQNQRGKEDTLHPFFFFHTTSLRLPDLLPIHAIEHL